MFFFTSEKQLETCHWTNIKCDSYLFYCVPSLLKQQAHSVGRKRTVIKQNAVAEGMESLHVHTLSACSHVGLKKKNQTVQRNIPEVHRIRNCFGKFSDTNCLL